jgi:hypothetical protein
MLGFFCGIRLLFANNTSDPISIDRIANSWNVFAFGSIGGLFIQFIRQLYLNRHSLPNVSPQAWYLLTRLLPGSVFLGAIPFALSYLAPYLPAGFYLAFLVIWFFVVIVQMISHNQFYKLVLEPNRRTAD